MKGTVIHEIELITYLIIRVGLCIFSIILCFISHVAVHFIRTNNSPIDYWNMHIMIYFLFYLALTNLISFIDSRAFLNFWWIFHKCKCVSFLLSDETMLISSIWFTLIHLIRLTLKKTAGNYYQYYKWNSCH